MAVSKVKPGAELVLEGWVLKGTVVVVDEGFCTSVTITCIVFESVFPALSVTVRVYLWVPTVGVTEYCMVSPDCQVPCWTTLPDSSFIT